MTTSTLTKSQSKTYGPRTIEYDGRKDARIEVHVRYDDQCGNGHNTFAITATIYGGYNKELAGGCLHDEIAKAFPELEPFIKWHLCSSDGPMHYPANAIYHANDRDCWGLRKGESRQLRNGKSGKLSWELSGHDLPRYVDSDEQPAETALIKYVPWCRIGEGKERDLRAARSCAIWPDATDEQLMSEDLEQVLLDRLPALMAEFQSAVESMGFVF